MINWFNMPSEGLSNGGQFEIKELTATENKTYEKDGEVYNKVTVNVSGGGSSDFSTAEVTINSSTSIHYNLLLATYLDYDDTGIMIPSISSHDIGESLIIPVLLYKGHSMCALSLIGQSTPSVSISGNIEDAGQNTYTITGDCTMTISDPE